MVYYNDGSRFHAHNYERVNHLPCTTCYEIHGTDYSERIIGGSGYDYMFGNGGFDTVLDYELGIDFCSSIEDGC